MILPLLETNSDYNNYMKVGDLVKHGSASEYLSDWIGVILGFDDEGDPLVQWWEAGVAIDGKPAYEYKHIVERM